MLEVRIVVQEKSSLNLEMKDWTRTWPQTRTPYNREREAKHPLYRFSSMRAIPLNKTAKCKTVLG